MFNGVACFWPKGYQRESLGKSDQNDDYLKQAMQKVVFPRLFPGLGIDTQKCKDLIDIR